MSKIFFIVLMMLWFIKCFRCQKIVTSEIGSDTCISFSRPSLSYGEKTIIIRNEAQLCVKYSDQNILLDPNAWNRIFSCNESSWQLAVCFTNTKVSDAGRFYLSNEDGNVTLENYTLNVEYPPNVSIMNEQKVIEGDYFSVSCNYTEGNPPSTTVYWTNDDPYFRQYQRHLTITNVTRSDSGTYVCFAENTYSSGRRGTSNNTMQLDVQYPPTISLPSTEKPIQGEDLTVFCNITEGNPSPITQVTWTRSGYSFVQNGNMLSLLNIRRSQSGTYTCTAENTYFTGTRGRDTQSMTIDVEYPPRVSPFSTNYSYPVESTNLNVPCSVTNGNPSSTLYYWTKLGDSDFQQNNTNLRLYSINRNQSGTYICTAENTYSSGSKGSDSQQLSVDVQFPPLVSDIADITPVEHDDVRVQCNVTKGNPSSTNIFWTKSGSSGAYQYGSTLVLNSIRRGQNGRYYCVAENSFNSGGNSRGQKSFFVNVLYGPTLTGGTVTVSEGQQASMTATVTSNPPSRVSWFRGSDLLYTQSSVNGYSTYTLSSAQCTDTGQFRVVASNGIQNNASTTVYLYVYCSPRLNSSGSSIFIPIGVNKYMDGQVTILSYPQPNYTLTLPNGAPNTDISLSITTITTNIYRITLRKSNIQPKDHGTYKMIVSNAYGTRILDINVHPRSRPLKTDQVFVSCGYRKAHITWQSSFFGYGVQNSIVQYSTNPYTVVFSNGSGLTPERIEQELLHVTVSGLRDNTKYFFRVATSNRYGVSVSSVVNCTTETSKGDASSATIATGAVLGTLLALSIAAVAFLSYNYFQEKITKKETPREYEAIEKRQNSCANHLYEAYEVRQCANEELSGLPKENEYTPEPTSKDQVVYVNIKNAPAEQKAVKDKIKPKPKPKPKPKS